MVFIIIFMRKKGMGQSLHVSLLFGNLSFVGTFGMECLVSS